MSRWRYRLAGRQHCAYIAIGIKYVVRAGQ
jgi:hypothetical protein